MTRLVSARLMPVLVVIGVVIVTAAAVAQTPAAAPQALSYERAQQVIDAAEAESRKSK